MLALRDQLTEAEQFPLALRCTDLGLMQVRWQVGCNLSRTGVDPTNISCPSDDPGGLTLCFFIQSIAGENGGVSINFKHRQAPGVSTHNPVYLLFFFVSLSSPSLRASFAFTQGRTSDN